jgi:hypothetical protein
VFNFGTKEAIRFGTLSVINFLLHDPREPVQSEKAPPEERISRREFAECLEFDKDLVDQDGMVKVAKLGILGKSGDVVESRTLSDAIFVPDRDNREVGVLTDTFKEKGEVVLFGLVGLSGRNGDLGKIFHGKDSLAATESKRSLSSESVRGRLWQRREGNRAWWSNYVQQCDIPKLLRNLAEDRWRILVTNVKKLIHDMCVSMIIDAADVGEERGGQRYRAQEEGGGKIAIY